MTFILGELHSALLAPYILPFPLHLFSYSYFTNFVSRCVMLHIPFYSSHTGFPTIAENPHDDVFSCVIGPYVFVTNPRITNFWTLGVIVANRCREDFLL